MRPENKTEMSKVIDYVLYGLAGGVLATMSFSFMLWLRF